MEDNSKYTAIKRDKISFPLNILLKNNKISGCVLDFGCGHGSDVDLLKEKGYKVVGYDPYFFPTIPTEQFDTIICFYVLNVLPKEDECKIIANITSLLKPKGKAYFAVRRDIVKEGQRLHVKHKKYTFQRKVYLNDQESVFKNKNCEIYEFTHFSVKNKGNFDLNPFLSGDDYRKPFSETQNFIAFYSKYPYSKYHIILTHKEKYRTSSDFSVEEKNELNFFLKFCTVKLSEIINDETIEIKKLDENRRLIKVDQWHLHLLGGDKK